MDKNNSYWVEVRTTGKYNANRSTKTICMVTTHYLDHAVIENEGLIEQIHRDLSAACSVINKGSKSKKSLAVSRVSGGMNGTKVFSVYLEPVNHEDDTFLHIRFYPVRFTIKEWDGLNVTME